MAATLDICPVCGIKITKKERKEAKWGKVHRYLALGSAELEARLFHPGCLPAERTLYENKPVLDPNVSSVSNRMATHAGLTGSNLVSQVANSMGLTMQEAQERVDKMSKSFLSGPILPTPPLHSNSHCFTASSTINGNPITGAVTINPDNSISISPDHFSMSAPIPPPPMRPAGCSMEEMSMWERDQGDITVTVRFPGRHDNKLTSRQVFGMEELCHNPGAILLHTGEAVLHKMVDAVLSENFEAPFGQLKSPVSTPEQDSKHVVLTEEERRGKYPIDKNYNK